MAAREYTGGSSSGGRSHTIQVCAGKMSLPKSLKARWNVIFLLPAIGVVSCGLLLLVIAEAQRVIVAIAGGGTVTHGERASQRVMVSGGEILGQLYLPARLYDERIIAECLRCRGTMYTHSRSKFSQVEHQ